MKINAIQGYYFSTDLKKKDLNKSELAITQNPAQVMSLPDFSQVGAMRVLNPIAFGANNEEEKVSERNKKLVQEIKDAEETIEVLKSTQQSNAFKIAVEENNFYNYFAKNRSQLYDKAWQAANDAENTWKDTHGWLYRITHSSEKDNIRSKKMSEYYDMCTRYDRISLRYDANKAIIEAGLTDSKERDERIRELSKLIETSKKMIDYNNLQNLIDDMLNGKDGLENRIAGYKPVKDKIKSFITMLQEDKSNGENIPPCVVLFGATGTGKSTFLRSIEDMTKDQVDIIRFKDSPDKDVMEQFNEIVAQAKTRFKETGKRTILLMDDAEKYFCMSEADAKTHYKDQLDEDDWDKIQKYNSKRSNSYVKDFKYILDDLAKNPTSYDDDSSYKSAMSIFITTNHPNIIDRQLLKRPDKMNAYHVGPAQGDDLKAVVRHYFANKKPIIDTLKMYENREDRETAIRGLKGLTDDAKENVLKHFKENKAHLYNIDDENIPQRLLDKMEPTIENGAYSNVMIKTIAANAFSNYLEDPEDSFLKYFNSELKHTARDVEPVRYKRYLETAEQVNLFKEKHLTNVQDKVEFFESYLDMSDGMLPKEEVKLLQEYIFNCEARLENLEDKANKGLLSESECVELEELRDLESYINNPDKMEEYIKQHKADKK